MATSDGKRLHVFIKHSPTFWEVRPPTKVGMKLLLDYIRMYWRRLR